MPTLIVNNGMCSPREERASPEAIKWTSLSTIKITAEVMREVTADPESAPARHQRGPNGHSEFGINGPGEPDQAYRAVAHNLRYGSPKSVEPLWKAKIFTMSRIASTKLGSVQRAITLSVAEMRHIESRCSIQPEGPNRMEYMPPTSVDAGVPDATIDRIRRYIVPAGLSPEEKFEHWRTWYGSAIDTPVRLEKTSKLVGRSFNPTALSLDGPEFSLVDVTNEPATCYWNGDSRAGDWLVHFRSSCPKFSFSGRPEEVSGGTVRFLDLSSPGNFHAPAGLSAVRLQLDRRLLGLDDKLMKRLQGLADIRENPLVRGLILPLLSGWQRTGIDQEMTRLQPVVRSMMTALVNSLLEAPADPSDTKLARIVAIKKFIRKNYRNQALDVDEIVAYSFLSRRSLYYLFEEEEFQVNGYIRALRTAEALELLTAPNSWKRSLTVTAEASGFTSLQAMRRAVRESTGFSLREVRENPEVVRIQAAELIKLIGP